MHERRLMDIDQSCIFVRQMIFYRHKDIRHIYTPRENTDAWLLFLPLCFQQENIGGVAVSRGG